MEKGVKQESSYPLLVIKRDQTNKINAEGVYRWQPLAWGPGLDGSSIDLQLFQEWVRCSHASCTHTHQGWSGMEAEWKRIRSDVSRGWKGTSQGAGGREEEGQEGSRTMTYHDSLTKMSGEWVVMFVPQDPQTEVINVRDINVVV